MSDDGDATVTKRLRTDNPSCTFYSTWFCPYAQRAWIALEYKGVSYKWVEAVLYEGDPSSKRALPLAEKERLTPGFVQCSPRGLVPALLHCDAKIFDSIPVMEYIEETFDGLNLLPTHLARKALIRSGILLWNELVIRRFYTLLMSASADAIARDSAALLAGFEEMIPYFCNEGPFFSSEGFSLFECSALPWFQRLVVLKAYRSFSLPDREPFNRLTLWYDACLSVPAYARTVVDSSKLVSSYVGYADNSGDNNCTQITARQGQSQAPWST
jgi:glutathione S-transferase